MKSVFAGVKVEVCVCAGVRGEVKMCLFHFPFSRCIFNIPPPIYINGLGTRLVLKCCKHSSDCYQVTSCMHAAVMTMPYTERIIIIYIIYMSMPF